MHYFKFERAYQAKSAAMTAAAPTVSVAVAAMGPPRGDVALASAGKRDRPKLLQRKPTSATCR
jgi:hypothetical protein